MSINSFNLETYKTGSTEEACLQSLYKEYAEYMSK